jgi:hypothetical protein
MQQGDCNAPLMFQRSMNTIFHDYIGIFMHTYLDNLFVYSDTIEEHQIHLEMVFAQLHKHEFYLRKDKCELYTDSIDCLGHRIDDKGLHANADKMAKIREWNTPCNFNDVQRFLGLVQYLAHFLPDVMAYTSPLASITANGTPFSWRPIHEKCFQTIKAMCCQTPILRPIDHRKDEPIWIICDADDTRPGKQNKTPKCLFSTTRARGRKRGGLKSYHQRQGMSNAKARDYSWGICDIRYEIGHPKIFRERETVFAKVRTS